MFNLIISLLIAFLLWIPTSSAKSLEDTLRPHIPLNPEVAELCPVSILSTYSLKKNCSGTPENPILSGCKGVHFAYGCGRGWTNTGYTSLSLEYFKYNIEHNEFMRFLEIGLHHQPFEQFVEQGAKGAFFKDKTGHRLS